MQQIAGWIRKPVTLAAGAAVLCGLALLVWYVVPQGSSQPVDEPATLDAQTFAGPLSAAAGPEAPAATPPGTVVVYISGAVRAPDVYQLATDARVKDLVLAAGGLADNADPVAINLAEPLADGQHVHITARGEAAPVAADAPAAGAASGDLLDINSATSTEFEALPGIGKTTAERIVAYRSEQGPFASVDDLKQVKGIGPALFAKIAPLVTVGS